jgi:RNA polymerase sigma-70 factor (sigma-E family)
VTFDDWASTGLDRLLRFAAVLCGSSSLAEDVVQDVLIKALGRWDTVQAADRPDSYLRRMVVNEYLSWRRKWLRIVPHMDMELRVDDHAVDPAIGVVDRDQIVAELAKLPRPQRAVLVLRYYCGYSDSEIVDLLGCSPSTVRSYASRALAALRVELTTPAPEPHPRKGASHAY